MGRIIISFSTIPSRKKHLKSVLISLINQTIKPDKIYINVPKRYNRFKKTFKKPKFLEDKYFKDVEINYMAEDYGPATKFIGSLINDKIKDDDLLLITDDDVQKVKNWIDTLKTYHKDNRVTCFVEKNLGKEIIWGYLGYIFKKSLFNINDVLDFYSNVKDKCYLVDDHWFTGFCHFKKIEIYNIPIITYHDVNNVKKGFKHGDSKNSLVRLSGKDNRSTASENCRKIIKEKYNTVFPFWCCIGCCNKKSIETFESVSPISQKTIYILFLIAILFSIKNPIIKRLSFAILVILIIIHPKHLSISTI